MLRKNATGGPQCELDFTHDQPCGLWYTAKGRVSSKIQERRVRLAGHIHQLLLWEPTQGARGRVQYIQCSIYCTRYT